MSGVSSGRDLGGVERDTLADREVLADELNRAEWVKVRESLGAVMAVRDFDDLSDRTKRLRHNQFLGHADAFLSSSWLAELENATIAKGYELAAAAVTEVIESEHIEGFIGAHWIQQALDEGRPGAVQGGEGE